MKTIYGIKDKVTGKVEAVIMAENDKTVVRQLAFTGYWQINRLEDTEIIEIETIKEEKAKGRIVKLDKEIEELKLHLENKAETIDKEKKSDKMEKPTAQEVKKDDK